MMATNEIEKKRFAYGNKGSVSFKPRMPVKGSRPATRTGASHGQGDKMYPLIDC